MLTFSSSLPFVLPRAHSRAFCQVPRLRLIADAFGALVRHLHPSCACAHPFSALMSSFGFVLAGDPSTTFGASQRGTLRSCGSALKACARLVGIGEGRQVHAVAGKAGFLDRLPPVENALVTVTACAGTRVGRSTKWPTGTLCIAGGSAGWADVSQLVCREGEGAEPRCWECRVRYA
jgi:hypothetical protein